MNKSLKVLFMTLLTLSSFGLALAQSSTGSISGTVSDERQGVIQGASVTVKNVDTGFTRTSTVDSEGRYRFVNLPIGSYEVTVEAANFTKYVQTGITLLVNQDAVINTALKPGGVAEVVTVAENASVLNTTTAEVSTRFDERRLSELPIATNRNVFNVLLSVPGVSQISPNQSGFANGVSFSSNGGRLRSNNFMIDGQDINDPSVSGGQIPLNNPDAIQEARIITNQFLAEYGRNSGSIVNFIGKSGTNDFHGSMFIFHNNNRLNSCSNLDKAAGFCNKNATDESRTRAPHRIENQFGFTIGGPVYFPTFEKPWYWAGKDKTFFFGDLQRWTDRALGSGSTINGAPTAAGRATLQQFFGSLPQVQALLAFVPPGTTNVQNITAGGQVIQVGNLTGSSSSVFNNDQGSFRIDHRFNENNLLYGRYRGSKSESTGGGQVTPPGITNIVLTKTYAATIVLNSIISSNLSNEARIAWSRFDSSTNAQDPSSETIPSIEISELGMNGFNALASRTAFGLAVNLPQFRINDTYQITDSLTYITGDHAFKFGVDLRRTDVSSFFLPTTRGRLQYTTLNNFLLDTAQVASINLPLRGGDTLAFYRWKEYYVFAQDEWKIKPNFTLTYGLRYEYPGDSFSNLKALNERILTANNNNPGFIYEPQPEVDTNNFMPRLGFNWMPRTRDTGILGFLTGGDKTVLRGGYSRTYDANFININLNIFSSFPFVAIENVPSTQPAFVRIQSLVGGSPNIPSVAAALLQTRTVVSGDFRAPATDQFSLELQRELSSDMVMKIGYVRTRGTGLFQTVDGNPRRPCVFGSGLAGTNTCNNTGINPFTGTAVPRVLAPRADPARGTIRLRTNSASSTYDALQVSLNKRLSRGFSGGIHYTWSVFIDDASEIFNPSGGEVAVSMDSFNRNLDRGRSSYDRPHRLAGNIVYEFPFYRDQSGFAGKLLGGWQVNSNFTFQSGAPFSVLNGLDPAGALDGINALVGDAIRPNVYTNLDVSRLTVADLFLINQQLRNQALATAQANFNALPAGPCVPGLLPGAALNNLLFARAAARITCTTNQMTGVITRGFVVDFNGIEPGQRVGNAGRSLLRSDGISNVDFGVIKNTMIGERMRLQLRADMFNVFNNRNFGIPEGRGNAASFLNQWATDGGNRRIILGARFVF